MISYRYGLLLVIIILAGCIAFYAFNEKNTAIPPVEDSRYSVTMKMPELVTYVNSAADYAQSVGKEAALAEFNDINGQFTDGDLYIFAHDMNGTTLALPYEPEYIGVNQIADTDIYGNLMVAETIDAVSHGSSIVTYYYHDPSERMAVRQKNAYCTPIDDTWFIGSGIYSSRTLPAPSAEITGPNPTADELKAFVESAADYAREHGKEATITAFSDKNGQFVRDGMYILAYDTNTTNLAHAYQPWIQGLFMDYYRDIDNVRTVRAADEIVKLGGGYSYSIYRIVIGNKSLYIPKLDYFVPIDETWFIGAGTIHPDYVQYKNGNLTGLYVRNGTVEDLVSLVNTAVAYAEEHGKDATLSIINDPNGTFTTKDVWLWAGDMNGTLIADPYMKDAIGTNIFSFNDTYQSHTTDEAFALVKSGGGFVHGMFPDTRTGSDIDIPKLMYLKPVDDTWWIAGGLYGVQVE